MNLNQKKCTSMRFEQATSDRGPLRLQEICALLKFYKHVCGDKGKSPNLVISMSIINYNYVPNKYELPFTQNVRVRS